MIFLDSLSIYYISFITHLLRTHTQYFDRIVLYYYIFANLEHFSKKSHGIKETYYY